MYDSTKLVAQPLARTTDTTTGHGGAVWLQNSGSSSSSCYSEEICYKGYCIPGSDDFRTCSGDGNCYEYERCTNGYCVNDNLKCSWNSDCYVGEECKSGYCIPSSSSGSDQSCDDDFDCDFGYACYYDGYCIKECFWDDDCNIGQVCDDGYCL